MLHIYRSLLYLYPPACRLEFGDEMAGVFLQGKSSARGTGLGSIRFYIREFCGLLNGAVNSHLRSIFGIDDWLPFRRWNMRPGFRFPRSTVFLMCVILAGVVLAIEKAKTIVQMKQGLPPGSVWDPLPWSLLLALALVLAAVVTVWGILFALQRSGMHRLASIQTWAERR